MGNSASLCVFESAYCRHPISASALSEEEKREYAKKEARAKKLEVMVIMVQLEVWFKLPVSVGLRLLSGGVSICRSHFRRGGAPGSRSARTPPRVFLNFAFLLIKLIGFEALPCVTLTRRVSMHTSVMYLGPAKLIICHHPQRGWPTVPLPGLRAHTPSFSSH